jgi:Flp pilus assembly protein TadG
MKVLDRGFSSDQSGSVAVITALLLVALFGLASLAIDVGHLVVVQNELQRAVDAGALAGARALVPYMTASIPPQPDWDQGQTNATETTERNKGDNQLLTNCTVQAGYWNLGTKTLQSTGISPTNLDVPAILVTASKSPGQNGGPVTMFLAPVLGFNVSSASAHALAFISSLSGIPAAGGGFPLAVPQALVDQYWYQSPPLSFKIGSTYHDPVGGQWTSFKVDSNNVPTIRSLMANGNPDPLDIGDNIWIQPGTKDTLFGDAAAYIGQTFVLPVVTTDFSTHDYTPILGFVSFYIEDTHQGSGPYIQGHFVKDHAVTQGNPGGPYNGTFIPPKEVYY